jgi:uncharacterized protein (DUF1800 family)
LAKKLYAFFVSEAGDADPGFIESVAATYHRSQYDMRAVMRTVLTSAQFWDQSSYFARYSWPAEFVVRALKEIGWRGASVNDALGLLSGMGQLLFDPPDVSGWHLGQSRFSSGAMLSRMNYASLLAANQRFNLAAAVKPYSGTPETFLTYYLDQLQTAPLDGTVVARLRDYLVATAAWTASDSQLRTKAAGLVHLVAGLPEYQFV